MNVVNLTSQEFADKLGIGKEAARLLLRGLTDLNVVRYAFARREANRRGRGETVYEMGEDIVSVLVELRKAYALPPATATEGSGT